MFFLPLALATNIILVLSFLGHSRLLNLTWSLLWVHLESSRLLVCERKLFVLRRAFRDLRGQLQLLPVLGIDWLQKPLGKLTAQFFDRDLILPILVVLGFDLGLEVSQLRLQLLYVLILLVDLLF